MKMSHLTEDFLLGLYKRYGGLGVLDDIITNRAADEPLTQILGYPRHSGRVDEYEYFTGKQLDRYIDGAVKRFMAQGILPVSGFYPAKQELNISSYADSS